ncbi:MAG: hypothetical protein AAFR27_00905 [Pseudomonadota bacterium]
MRFFKNGWRAVFLAFSIIILIWQGNASADNDAGLSIRFYGSSTLLIEDHANQILIDGFFTRTRHRYLGLIQPDTNQVADMVRHTGICIAPLVSETQKRNCRSGKTLDIIIPVHGHYDHALDTGVLALWSGTRLVADPSIKAVLAASTSLAPRSVGAEHWLRPNIIAPFADDSQAKSKPIVVGDFKIRLIRSPHFSSLPTFLIRGTTALDLQFPAGLGDFRLGTSFSVHIEHKKRSLLIVPSAGKMKDTFRNQPSLQAETVFLGVGGLGAHRRTTIEAFWRDTVTAVGAQTAYLVHWDSDQVTFDLNEPVFKAARPSLLRRTWRIFQEAKTANVKLAMPPAIKPFSLD